MTQPRPHRSSYNYRHSTTPTSEHAPETPTKNRPQSRAQLTAIITLTALVAAACSTSERDVTVEPTTPKTHNTLPTHSLPTNNTTATPTTPSLINPITPTTNTPTTNLPRNVGTRPANTHYYLALGDSIPAGFDPVTSKPQTAKGYPTLVAKNIQKRWGGAGVKLINHSCSGETSKSFRTGAGSGCFKSGSQQKTALESLAKHGATTKLITLQLGANNILPCMQGLTIDRACADRGIAQTKKDLNDILPKLRAAAPNAQIIVVDYYNPMLTLHSVPLVGPSLAKESQAVVLSMNSMLKTIATQYRAQIANVAPGFHLTDWKLTGPRQEPQNLVRACELTGMCDYLDIHPKPAGHTVIAGAITAAVR